MRVAPVTAAALLGALAVAAPAQGASSLVIRGAGYGHGVGLSQYGTLGFARAGWTHEQILAHYYTGTKLGRLTSSPAVRVLLRSGRARYAVTGAADANGMELDPAKRYFVTGGGRGAVLRDAEGEALATAPPPLRLSAASGSTIRLEGPADNGLRDGSYRGAMEFRPGVGGLLAVNALGLEEYLAGVVSAEVPSSWPDEALRAQTVAARTYAITSIAGGGEGFTQYADTRSQMYRGVAAETAATTAAVRATSSRIVTYDGNPVTTYFFSSSGGRTENVENSFIGGTPRPWLKSVKDPYDTISPNHRWGPIKLSLQSATAKLRGLVPGRLRWIRVLRRGVSPRVVEAQLVGTDGAATVTGPQLRKALGLRDHWMRFTTFSSDLTKRPPAKPPPLDPGAKTDPQTGGAHTSSTRLVLSGSIRPARAGDWARVERLRSGRWTHAADVLLERGGRYSATVHGSGRYRVTYAGLSGPEVGR